MHQEETLDPADWAAMRALAHTMVDDMFTYLENIRAEPCWRKPGEDMKAHLSQPLPREGQPIEEVYNDFKNNILPYPKGNIHPRFWAWVQGTGTPFAMMAEMLAAAVNPNVTIGDHAAMYVDEQVLNWCKEMLGYPADASGILLSGGSMANNTALIVARNSFGERNARARGADVRWVVYTSVETHSSIQKAAEIAGLGNEAVRKIKVDADYRLDMADLEAQLSADKAAGRIPFCVVANAGTVNTGAIDPLAELLALCRREGMWFHVDGAFGALAKLAPAFQEVLQPMTEADSLAFDLHKWMYMPYEVGCLLVKDAAAHRAAFALQPSYLLSHERGLAAGPDPIANYGMELSRGFKSLKVWMSFKEHGIAKFARLIEQNIAQIRYLVQLIDQEPELELLAPAPLNIACFRYKPLLHEGVDLNALNKEILMRLHEEAVALPSYTLLNGQYAIRVANVNHRSRREDFEALVDGVLRIGRELAK